MNVTALSKEEQLQERVSMLSTQVLNLNQELAFFRSEDKNPGWLQSKIMRQAKVLTSLNKRVRIQRLMLRELNAQDPELANTLFNLIKDKYSTELDEVTDIAF